ncbi:IS110 family transposase [bacterium]|nr:IS110 family transposase [bacterium]
MSRGCFVGIDVSKAWLDVAGRPDPAPRRVANDPAGVAALVADLRGLAPALVLLEATGGLELPVVAALQVAGLPVAVVNPRQVRDFARATGQLAKTDRLDAALLARFAEAIRPAPAAAVPEDVRRLDAMLTRRNQLIAMRVMETNRLDRLTDGAVRKEVQKHVAWLTKAIDRADTVLAGAVKASPVWQARDALLQSIPGVGPVATLTLLAGLPELGTTTGSRLAALVGLAPFADDSGSRQGGRHIRGGRAPVRRALYLAALSAVVHNPAMRSFKERLAARGKRPKVILTAVARKLLVVANAIIQSGQPWRAEAGDPVAISA